MPKEGGGTAKERSVKEEWADHVRALRAVANKSFQDDVDAAFKAAAPPQSSKKSSKPYLEWQGKPGHQVPYRYRIPELAPRKTNLPAAGSKEGDQGAASKASTPEKEVVVKEDYTDYCGLRFPTLETAENFDYHKDRGMDRAAFERVYPIKVPGYRRLDPYLREYIFFLHSLDPARFTVERIAERYRLRARTVMQVVQEWSVNRYLLKSGLVEKLGDKQQTRESLMLKKKEGMYAKWVGWDQLGDQDDPESDDEALGKFQGWRSTSDWVRRQSIEVEMMRAFPMSEKRDPMPKRVDVDLVVDNTRDFKVINWIDPSDKVVF